MQGFLSGELQNRTFLSEIELYQLTKTATCHLSSQKDFFSKPYLGFAEKVVCEGREQVTGNR